MERRRGRSAGSTPLGPAKTPRPSRCATIWTTLAIVSIALSRGLSRSPISSPRADLAVSPFLGDSLTGTDIVANTTNCILMMELYFSPRLPAMHLVAQKLFQNISVEVASYDDCHLFVSGGTHATAPYMDERDAFFVGNYDFADGVYHLLEKYADSGNISTMAACGTLHNCPVVNVDYLYSKSNIEFRFCVGGAELAAAAWGV